MKLQNIDEQQWSIEAARGVIMQFIQDGIALDETALERASNAVHVAWINRHEAQATGQDLLPYDQLPESEKEKDRKYVRLAIEELNAVS